MNKYINRNTIITVGLIALAIVLASVAFILLHFTLWMCHFMGLPL